MTVHSHQHHLGKEASVRSVEEFRQLLSKAETRNAKVAIVVTDVLGSMWTAYLLSLIALVSLPAVLYAAGVIPKPGFMAAEGLILIVTWIAQTFIQLVALSVLQVSSNANGRAQEQNTRTLLADGEINKQQLIEVLDRLDTRTEGGLQEILDAIRQQADRRGE